MDRGVWGEGGEGVPVSYARASCARSATPACYVPALRARYVRATTRGRIMRASACVRTREGGRGYGGGREPQGEACPVCGPVLGWTHDHETRDPCNHPHDHT